MLSELIELLSPILSTETSVFKSEKCNEYAVLTPLIDKLDLYTDDFPTAEIIEVRISIYCKGNYQNIKNKTRRPENTRNNRTARNHRPTTKNQSPTTRTQHQHKKTNITKKPTTQTTTRHTKTNPKSNPRRN